MRQIVLSGIAALVLTSGVALAKQPWGIDKQIFEPLGGQTTEVVKTEQEPRSTFDGFGKNTLPSVEQDKDKPVFGVR